MIKDVNKTRGLPKEFKDSQIYNIFSLKEDEMLKYVSEVLKIPFCKVRLHKFGWFSIFEATTKDGETYFLDKHYEVICHSKNNTEVSIFNKSLYFFIKEKNKCNEDVCTALYYVFDVGAGSTLIKSIEFKGKEVEIFTHSFDFGEKKLFFAVKVDGKFNVYTSNLNLIIVGVERIEYYCNPFSTKMAILGINSDNIPIKYAKLNYYLTSVYMIEEANVELDFEIEGVCRKRTDGTFVKYDFEREIINILDKDSIVEKFGNFYNN